MEGVVHIKMNFFPRIRSYCIFPISETVATSSNINLKFYGKKTRISVQNTGIICMTYKCNREPITFCMLTKHQNMRYAT